MYRLTGYIFFIIIGAFTIALTFYQKLGVFKKNVHALSALNYCLDSSDYNDIIYIGNSRVIYHINPAVIDSLDKVKSYCVAIDGSKLIEQNLLLNEYLLNHPKPETVFLNIDYNMFDTNGVPNDITNYFTYLNVPSVYGYLSPYKLAYRYKLVQYYYYIQKIFALPDEERKARMLNALFNSSPPKVYQAKYFRGFTPKKRSWSARAENELRTVKSEISYQASGFTLLQSMVDRCRRDSINVIFLVPPAYYEIGTKFLNEAEVINKAKDLAVKLNVPFWDYRSLPICKSKDFFYDFLHLDEQGAALYSQQLALDIKEKLYTHDSSSLASLRAK